MTDWQNKDHAQTTPAIISYDIRYLLDRIETKLDLTLEKYDGRLDLFDNRINKLESWRDSYEHEVTKKDKARDQTFLVLGAVFTVLFILATVLVPVLGG